MRTAIGGGNRLEVGVLTTSYHPGLRNQQGHAGRVAGGMEQIVKSTQVREADRWAPGAG